MAEKNHPSEPITRTMSKQEIRTITLIFNYPESVATFTYYIISKKPSDVNIAVSV